jgi:hypothetical protein
MKPRKSQCNLAVNEGNCQAKLRRFFFDLEEGICKLFIFGGCTGTPMIMIIIVYGSILRPSSDNWAAIVG